MRPFEQDYTGDSNAKPKGSWTVQALQFKKLISGQCYTHIETSRLICSVDQSTGFYMSVTLTRHGLKGIIHNFKRVNPLMPSSSKKVTYTYQGFYMLWCLPCHSSGGQWLWLWLWDVLMICWSVYAGIVYDTTIFFLFCVISTYEVLVLWYWNVLRIFCHYIILNSIMSGFLVPAPSLELRNTSEEKCI